MFIDGYILIKTKYSGFYSEYFIKNNFCLQIESIANNEKIKNRL